MSCFCAAVTAVHKIKDSQGWHQKVIIFKHLDAISIPFFFGMLTFRFLFSFFMFLSLLMLLSDATKFKMSFAIGKAAAYFRQRKKSINIYTDFCSMRDWKIKLKAILSSAHTHTQSKKREQRIQWIRLQPANLMSK